MLPTVTNRVLPSLYALLRTRELFAQNTIRDVTCGVYLLFSLPVFEYKLLSPAPRVARTRVN